MVTSGLLKRAVRRGGCDIFLKCLDAEAAWREDMAEHYGQHGDELLADGFETALIGFGFQFNAAVAIYDYERCLAILRDRDGMSADGALEFFEFNVAGAYVGPNTPVFVTRLI